MNQAGFFSYQNDRLYFEPNMVSFIDGCLVVDEHEQYTYPVNGWSWFDSEQAAKEYFGIKDKE